MTEFSSLKNHFLIAMPQLADPNFFHSVTLICEHNEEGAMGIVINQPLNVSTQELLDYMDIPTSERLTGQIMAGGPVHRDRGFVLHTGDNDWQSSLKVGDNITITTSQDILHAIGEEHGPSQSLIALGYAGWDAGQLEEEISANAWLVAPADSDVIFNTDVEQRWNHAAKLIGVAIEQMSHEVGHG